MMRASFYVKYLCVITTQKHFIIKQKSNYKVRIFEFIFGFIILL